MIIPDDIFSGDFARLLTDWGVSAVAEVVTTVSGSPVVTPTTVTIIPALHRVPGFDGALDVFEITITAATDALPTVPSGGVLRWQYDGHQWDVRERRDLAGDMVTVFIGRRAD